MSKRGYGFERETECWIVKLCEQDIKSDFSSRGFRTSTSGAATASKGDVRSLHVPWLEGLCIECKHLSQYTKQGAVFHLDLSLLEKIHKEASDCHSTPALTWAFKHVRTHKGQGRVQFVVPEHAFKRWLEAAGSPVCHYVMDQIPYYERKRKYYLVAHDVIWEHAGEAENITVFPIKGVFNESWLIISRGHLERLLVVVRENWKAQQGKAA